MFTGIIEEVGEIKNIKRGARSALIEVGAAIVLSDVKEGDSIAVNGVCLTVTEFTDSSFTADVMRETVERSSMGKLKVGNPVNLERAMVADGRFGGHIVSGHIDGTGKIIEIQRDEISTWYKIQTSGKILKYIIEKGSIAIDGISLTVAQVTDNFFKVSVIPHTLTNTALPTKRAGDLVNLENDCIGKYVEKLLNPANEEAGITREFLLKNGF